MSQSEKDTDIRIAETEQTRFWELIDLLRVEKGLKWYEVAEKANIPLITITVAKKKGTYPSITLIRAFANVFDVSVDYLLERTPVPCLVEPRFKKLLMNSRKLDDEKLIMLESIANTLQMDPRKLK